MPVTAFNDESETTLMAQKQKVKTVAKPAKHGTAKAAASKAAAITLRGAPAKKAKPAKTSKTVAAVSKKTVKSSVKPSVKQVTKPAPVKASAKVAASKAPVKTAGVVKAASPKSVKSTSTASTQAMAAKIQMKANARGQVARPSAPKPAAAPIAAAAARPAAPVHAPRAVPASIAKPAGQKITAPMPMAPAASAPLTPKSLAEKAVAARAMAAAPVIPKKPVSARHGFKTNEFVVYPAHGVGRIVGIEEQEIAGMTLELFVITFDKEKLTLRVPTGKLASIGMRKLAEDTVVKRAMETLKGRARVKRTMWSRRAQEYVAKINSGDLISIAEVVRDLYRSEAQPEQSYSERQLYENALERMAREIAAVERLDERGAVQRIVEILSKSAKGRRMAAEEAEAEAAGNETKAA